MTPQRRAQVTCIAVGPTPFHPLDAPAERERIMRDAESFLPLPLMTGDADADADADARAAMEINDRAVRRRPAAHARTRVHARGRWRERMRCRAFFVHTVALRCT